MDENIVRRPDIIQSKQSQRTLNGEDDEPTMSWSSRSLIDSECGRNVSSIMETTKYRVVLFMGHLNERPFLWQLAWHDCWMYVLIPRSLTCLRQTSNLKTTLSCLLCQWLNLKVEGLRFSLNLSRCRRLTQGQIACLLFLDVLVIMGFFSFEASLNVSVPVQRHWWQAGSLDDCGNVPRLHGSSSWAQRPAGIRRCAESNINRVVAGDSIAHIVSTCRLRL